MSKNIESVSNQNIVKTVGLRCYTY